MSFKSLRSFLVSCHLPLAFLLFSCLLPGQLSGQNLPGQPRARDRWEAEQARFRAIILERVNADLQAWTEGWNEDDLDELVDAYSEQGILFFPGEEPHMGRDAIREHFRSSLPEMGHISFSLNDFEPGGTVSLVLGRYHYRTHVGSPDQEDLGGHLVMVLVEEDGSWKIRSQVFRSDPTG